MAATDVRVQLSQASGEGTVSTTHKKIAGFGICFEVLAARLRSAQTREINLLIIKNNG